MSKLLNILGLEKHWGKNSVPGPNPPGSKWKGLKPSLSRVQTLVSLTAGIVSITGALIAIPNFFKSVHGKGELVTIVQDAKTGKALSDARIEILTPQGALIATLTPNSSGAATSTLDPGRFRVRVSHPQLGDQTREVQVVSSQSTEIRVQLRPSSSFPHTFKRFFSH
jgi:Carboxypeptidase regulatory-like domain